MKKYFLIISLIMALKSKAQSQEDSIKLTVNTLFLAMKNADTNLLKSCFMDSAILQTIVNNKQGKTFVKTETVNDFVKAISTIQKDAADEQIIFESIKVDANLANVYTPYKFYYNKQFSHCGANNFILVRVNNKWLIQYIIDTRRKIGC